jgi:multimeric flavodoxin WrbA
MKKILILDGSPKRNGRTASLKKAFVEGVKENGNKVTDLYLHKMNLKGCLACDACKLGRTERCVQHDDMDTIFEEFIKADVVVFISPMMWGTVSAQLRIGTDRFYAFCWNPAWQGVFKGKQMVLMMTAGADGQMPTEQLYAVPLHWYGIFEYLGMKSIGTVLGAGKEEEANKLGCSIG